MVRVSVIMGVYNCEDTIEEAVESILNQSYNDWELIICDDASVDNTFNILKLYQEKYPHKIKLLRNKNNLTLAGTLNRCLEVANGEYIARMDGDDISLENRLETQVRFLETNLEFDLVGSTMISFDEFGDIGTISINECPNKYSMKLDTPFCHATIMARKNIFDKLNGYRVKSYTKRSEDVDLWFRFYKAGFKGYNLQEPYYKVRVREKDFKRRTLRDGLNTAYVRLKGFWDLEYPFYYYIFLFKPILAGLIPAKIMKKIHSLRSRW